MSKKKKDFIDNNVYTPFRSYDGYAYLSNLTGINKLNINQIAQSTHAELCPVCKGSGKYVEYHFARGQYIGNFDFRTERTCHGCGGTGWVVISTVYGVR